MKKDIKKLSLDRETLVTLQPDVLEGVNGGLVLPTTSLPPLTTRTVTKTIQYTRDLVTRLANCNTKAQ